MVVNGFAACDCAVQKRHAITPCLVQFVAPLSSTQIGGLPQNFVNSQLALLFNETKLIWVRRVKLVKTDHFRREVIIETSVDDNQILDMVLANTLHENFRIRDWRKPDYPSSCVVVDKPNMARGNFDIWSGVGQYPVGRLNLRCASESGRAGNEIIQSNWNVCRDGCCHEQGHRQNPDQLD